MKKRRSKNHVKTNTNNIIIRGINENNLKNVSLSIPKGKIVILTGVFGLGKSSIVFDTIAIEPEQQLSEIFPLFHDNPPRISSIRVNAASKSITKMKNYQ